MNNELKKLIGEGEEIYYMRVNLIKNVLFLKVFLIP